MIESKFCVFRVENRPDNVLFNSLLIRVPVTPGVRGAQRRLVTMAAGPGPGPSGPPVHVFRARVPSSAGRYRSARQARTSRLLRIIRRARVSFVSLFFAFFGTVITRFALFYRSLMEH